MKEIGSIKSYKLSLEVLSPVFIGGADDKNICKLDYFYDKKNSKLCIIDKAKFGSYLIKTGKIDKFEKFVLNNDGSITLKKWFLDNNIDGAKQDFYTRSQHLGEVEIKNLNDIKMFIKNIYEQPYIPGSSIKGAIRQAILSHKILENKKNCLNLKENLNIATLIESKNESIMHGIEISDSAPIGESNLFFAQKIDYNDKKNNDKRGPINSLPIWREYLKTNTKTSFTITIDSNVFPYSMEDLFKFLKEFADFQNEQHKKILKNKKAIIKLPEDCKNDNGIRPNLCIGGGNGFLIKSLIYQISPSDDEARKLVSGILNRSFPKHKHYNDTPISPQIYKVVKWKDDFVPIGWCYISEEK